MKIEQKEGYTVIDRRGYVEPCRVCLCPTECHSTQYGKPTMKCIEYLRDNKTVTAYDVNKWVNDNKDVIALVHEHTTFSVDESIYYQNDEAILMHIKKV